MLKAINRRIGEGQNGQDVKFMAIRTKISDQSLKQQKEYIYSELQVQVHGRTCWLAL